MKLKYILSLLVAAVTLFTSCDAGDDHFLDEVKLSSTYVALDMEGGSQTVELTATDSWEITNVPEWLTVTPMSGAAGTQTLTFSAAKTLDGRNAEIKLSCAGKTQLINVIQGLATISQATCAEVNSGIEGKSYLVTGVVTKISNTSYGNFYINDGTGELYIYGCVDATGSYNWSKFNIEVGDEVTVQGPLTIYNGTYELKDATWVSTKKSLIKVESTTPEDCILPIEGGELSVELSVKGEGLSVQIPAEAKSWLSISSIADSKYVTFAATPNAGGDRTTEVTFLTKKDGKEYTAMATVTQKGSIVPKTIKECNEAEDNENQYYRVTGYIHKVNNLGKGRFYITDGTGEIYAYNIAKSKDDKSTDLSSVVKDGDAVTIVAYKTSYNGTIELVGYLEEVHTVYSTAEATALINSGSYDKDAKYFVSGTISKIDQVSTSYGNANYYISADGTEAGQLYVYRGYSMGGEKFTAEDEIALGNKVVLYGKFTTYNGTPQVNTGSAIVYKE